MGLILIHAFVPRGSDITTGLGDIGKYAQIVFNSKKTIKQFP